MIPVAKAVMNIVMAAVGKLVALAVSDVTTLVMAVEQRLSVVLTAAIAVTQPVMRVEQLMIVETIAVIALVTTLVMAVEHGVSVVLTAAIAVTQPVMRVEQLMIVETIAVIALLRTLTVAMEVAMRCPKVVPVIVRMVGRRVAKPGCARMEHPIILFVLIVLLFLRAAMILHVMWLGIVLLKDVRIQTPIAPSRVVAWLCAVVMAIVTPTVLAVVTSNP